MRAAVLEEVGQSPHVRDFRDPEHDVVDVLVAGSNPVDVALASGQMGGPQVPSVVGQEGVGTAADGQRVYFNSPPAPFGSWAERAAVNPVKTFPVPDGIDDDLAVALGIAGLAAWLPLTRHASVTGGESVLVLGATGVVGKIAIQAAKVLGAGRVVAAGRNRDALEQTTDLGADAIVVLGNGDDATALQKEAGEGFDVVIDPVYGDPFLAALSATAVGATLVTIGQSAAAAVCIPFRALMGRTHVGHGNNLMPPEVLRQGYEEITRHAAEGRIHVPTTRYRLDEAEKAWQAQKEGPHTKITVAPA